MRMHAVIKYNKELFLELANKYINLFIIICLINKKKSHFKIFIFIMYIFYI